MGEGTKVEGPFNPCNNIFQVSVEQYKWQRTAELFLVARFWEDKDLVLTQTQSHYLYFLLYLFTLSLNFQGFF